MIVVSSTRPHVTPNLLTIKLNAFSANDPEFDLEAALDDFVTFFGAGQETTATTMAFMLMECGRRPDIMEKYLC